jgi:hypothetical protein
VGSHEAAQAVRIGRLARVALRIGVVGLVMGLKRFEIIGEVGRPPVEAKLPAVGD